MTSVLDGISYAMIQYGESMIKFGPEKGFKLHTSRSASLFRNGNIVNVVSKSLGYGLTVVSTLWNTYIDVNSGEKTVGVALVKNTIKTAVGIGFTTLGLCATNPVGWGIVGVVVSGIGTGMVFDYTYNRNLLGLQSGLDAVGNVVDNYVVLPLIDAYDWSKVKVEEIGASISGAWETINPLNWGW